MLVSFTGGLSHDCAAWLIAIRVCSPPRHGIAAGGHACWGANAVELNLAEINAYAGQAPVTSLSQFSDVKPSDWSYQALSDLVNRYSCVAGSPNGSFQGRRAIGRYEGAALLNACLDRVTETTDAIKRLRAMGQGCSSRPAFQGLINSSPIASKSAVLRVASWAPWARVVAAITASAVAIGRARRSRRLTSSPY